MKTPTFSHSTIPTLCLGFLIFACGSGQETESKTEPPSPVVETPQLAPPSQQTLPEAINIDETGRALRGFDAVAYHRGGLVKLGNPSYNTQWQNAQWQFESAENLEAFLKDPDAYAPINGGFCTFGIVLKKKLDGDPKIWHLNDGRLFLFLNSEVKNKFLKDETGNIEKVTNNWPIIRDTPADELNR